MVCDLPFIILETNALFVSGQRIAYWFLRRPTNKAGFFIGIVMPRKNTDSYWFKFYPDKYLGGTAGFSFDMHGAYMIMLIQQWESGPFSAELAIKKIGKLWDKISFKFEKTEAGYANIRMAEESSHKREIAEIRRKAVLSRYKCTTNEGTNVLQTVSVSDSVSVSSFNTKKEKNVFTKPSLEDIRNYIKENRYSVEPEKWFNHYESNGWKVGKNPMKNWKAAVRTWEHSEYNKNRPESHRHVTPQVAL